MREIFRIIRELNSGQGVSILLVEQNARMALRVAGRAYVLERGEVRLSGTSEVLTRDPEVQRAFLGKTGVVSQPRAALTRRRAPAGDRAQFVAAREVQQ